MMCWQCKAEIYDRDDLVYFCHICGMQLRQECNYCGGIIECMSKECDKCGGMFSHCKNCHLSFDLEQFTCNICNEPTTQIRDIFIHFIGNPNSDKNCIVNEEDITVICDTLERNSKISPLVICNNNIIFWEEIGSKNCLICYNVKTKKNIWENNKGELISFSIDKIEGIEVRDTFVLTYTQDNLFINNILNGKLTTSIKMTGEYKASIIHKKLVVLQKNKSADILSGELSQTQQIDLYNYPFTNKTKTIPLGASDKKYGYPVFPVESSPKIYFSDFSGKIIMFDSIDFSTEILFQSEKNTFITYMMIYKNILFFSIKKNDNSLSLYKKDISQKSDAVLIVDRVTATLDKFMVCEDNIYMIVMNKFSQLFFSIYPIISHSSEISQEVSANTTYISDFYLIVIKGEKYLIYKCVDVTEKYLEIRKLNLETNKNELIKKVSKTACSCVVNMYNNTIIAELDTGVIQIGGTKK